MPFRFVHAADIHLDSPLKSLALRDPELAEIIGNATRRAFVGIIELCLTEQVDALLLAGDLYDGEQTSMKTARFIADEIGKLHRAGIAVFIIRGNHDALSRITKELVFPENVTLFSGRADAVELGGALPVVVHGISFAQPKAPDSLLAKYKPPVAGAFNIGLMHTSLGGAPGHDVYAPCSVAALHGSGFDYWALGHIHKRSEDKGPATIVMAGMPQGRDIGEFGPKSVSLVTVHDDRQVLVEQRLTSVAQFERVAVALDGAADLVEVAARMARALGGMRGQVAAPHLVARVRLTGVTELAWRLRCDADLVREQAIACAHSLDARTWIDKIEIDCIAPRGTADSEGVAIDELRQLLEEQVIGSDAYRLKVAAIRDELRGQLPRECRDALGRDEAESAAILDGLVAEGAADVLARLQGREAAGA